MGGPTNSHALNERAMDHKLIEGEEPVHEEAGAEEVLCKKPASTNKLHAAMKPAAADSEARDDEEYQEHEEEKQKEEKLASEKHLSPSEVLTREPLSLVSQILAGVEQDGCPARSPSSDDSFSDPRQLPAWMTAGLSTENLTGDGNLKEAPCNDARSEHYFDFDALGHFDDVQTALLGQEEAGEELTKVATFPSPDDSFAHDAPFSNRLDLGVSLEACGVDPALLLTNKEFHDALQDAAKYLQHTDLQDHLLKVRPALPTGLQGKWVVASSLGHRGTLESLRRSNFKNSSMPKCVSVIFARVAKHALAKYDAALLGSTSDYISNVLFSNLVLHCWPIEIISFMNHMEMLLLEGPPHLIPLERLEISWALQCYPQQLPDQEEDSRLKNLQSLRRAVNQILDNERCEPLQHGATQGLAGGSGHDGFEAMSDKRLLEIGHRTIDLIAMQDLMKAAAKRLWRNDDTRTAVHKALILAGCCRPEFVNQELVEADGVFPTDAEKHRLNLCLQNFGCEPLTSDASMYMRVKAREQCGKAHLVNASQRPVLVTAPHNIFLIRDEKPPHRIEDYTTFIAERMASYLGGSSLAWSRREQYRSELRWAVVKQKGMMDLPGNESGLLDPSNRDPNFLATEEVDSNEWFHKMKNISAEWRNKDEPPKYFNRKGKGLLVHLDIHGCRNPPHYEAHLNIGLGAMRQRLPDDRLEKLDDLGKRLIAATSGVIEKLRLEPKAAPVCVIYPQDPEDPPTLSGSWPPSERRHTQTQQAITFARFTHACQLEMSVALRKAFSQNKDAVDKLARKLWTVFENLDTDLIK